MSTRLSLVTCLLVACVPAVRRVAPPAAGPVALSGADQLQTQKRAWDAAQVKSYAFIYRDQCFCAGNDVSVRITVIDGNVVQAELAEAESPTSKRSSEFRRPTIDSLFAWIADAYARKADRIGVRYDPEYHFPSYAQIDWSVKMIDDEFAFEVREFAPKGSAAVPRP